MKYNLYSKNSKRKKHINIHEYKFILYENSEDNKIIYHRRVWFKDISDIILYDDLDGNGLYQVCIYEAIGTRGEASIDLDFNDKEDFENFYEYLLKMWERV